MYLLKRNNLTGNIMRTYKKEINGLKMSAYNDSGADWVLSSIDNDGFSRTEFYSQKSFTMKSAFELHAELYVNS